jgi:hypothetical protein
MHVFASAEGDASTGDAIGPGSEPGSQLIATLVNLLIFRLFSNRFVLVFMCIYI